MASTFYDESGKAWWLTGEVTLPGWSDRFLAVEGGKPIVKQADYRVRIPKPILTDNLLRIPKLTEAERSILSQIASAFFRDKYLHGSKRDQEVAATAFAKLEAMR